MFLWTGAGDYYRGALVVAALAAQQGLQFPGLDVAAEALDERADIERLCMLAARAMGTKPMSGMRQEIAEAAKGDRTLRRDGHAVLI